MSTLIEYPASSKRFMSHVSKDGWEIDRYSDGTWEGTNQFSFTSAITNACGTMYRTAAQYFPNPPTGFVITRKKGSDVYVDATSNIPIVWLSRTAGNTFCVCCANLITASNKFVVTFAAEGTWS